MVWYGTKSTKSRMPASILNTALSFLLALTLPGTLAIRAQGINNAGQLYIGSGASVGIYGDLINTGSWVSEASTFGFYGTEETRVQGNIPIEATYLEIAKDQGNVELQNSIIISEVCLFVSGDFITDPALEAHVIEFGPGAIPLGSGQLSKIRGWSRALDRDQFTFPLGGRDSYHPLTFQSNEPLAVASAAYVDENPTTPVSLPFSFNIGLKDFRIGDISVEGFWFFRASGIASISMAWFPADNLSTIAEELREIILVGWNRNRSIWEPIEVASRSGQVSQGSLTTELFNPGIYEAFALATVSALFEDGNAVAGDYFVSPNGDGINDALVLEHLELEGKNNQIHIFNRAGQKVFEYTNYTNQFTGFANSGSTLFGSGSRLPDGVYYYIVELLDDGLRFQGFFVLDD